MKEASPSGEASQGEIRGVSPQSPRACLAVTAFQTDNMRVEFDGTDLDLPAFEIEPEPAPGS